MTKALIYYYTLFKYLNPFGLYIKTDLKHYPNDLDCLFVKNSDRKYGMITACEYYFDIFVFKTVITAIGNLTPFDDPQLPILTHFSTHAPHLMKRFSVKYKYASCIKYSKGITLYQDRFDSEI